MKLDENPRLPPSVPVEVVKLLRDLARQVNAITEGNAHAHHGATTAAPTTGLWARGDFVKNSEPTKLDGLQYVIIGWECVTSGTPGTWVQVRALTGEGINITKLLTATATLDFPSVASNGSQSLTITVTGAASGDTVIVAPPATLNANLSFVGYVSSADTVTIRVHNNTGGAIDPASATWRATVMAFA